jgi:hypothetical protein
MGQAGGIGHPDWWRKGGGHCLIIAERSGERGKEGEMGSGNQRTRNREKKRNREKIEWIYPSREHFNKMLKLFDILEKCKIIVYFD